MALVQQNFSAADGRGGAPAAPAAPSVATVRMAAAPGVSRLALMQARFQKKQMEEKEQKLLRLYESQQQRAFQRVGRGSAGGSSTASLSSSTSTLASVGGGGGAGKVRQLFEERRTNGWDRSYPLEPVAGGKARNGHGNGHGGQHQSAAHPAATNPGGGYGQQGALPLAVPKTKVTRGASLDRAQLPAPAAKLAARRSKSHARGETAPHADAGKLYYDGGSGVGRSFRKIDDYNNRNYRNRQQPAEQRHDNYDDADGGFEDEDDINYETLGDDVRSHPLAARNGHNNNHQLDNRRQEELFAKYQVRELGNHDLLATSPPRPGPYGDDGIDDDGGGTFIYEKESPLTGDEPPPVNNGNDRYKTYVSNKHRGLYKEDIAPRAVMATRALDAKKGPAAAPAARRESLTPPSRPAGLTKTPTKKAEQGTPTKVETKSPPDNKARSGAVTSKTGANVASRPSSSSNKNTYNSNKKLQSSSTPKTKNGPTSQILRTAPSRDDLTECPICHRRFTNDRIKVHESICQKTAQKKRKEYDALKHRVQGTEAEQFVKRSLKHGASQKKVEPKKGDWRKKHEEFIQTIRAAKEAQAHVAAGGKLSDLPPPPPLDTSDYIQCPHCGRRFNEGAAERHIPRCANMQHNKPKVTSRPPGGPIKRR